MPEQIEKDAASGRWRKQVRADGQHQIWRWLSEVEAKDHEQHLASAAEMQGAGGVAVAAGAAPAGSTVDSVLLRQANVEQLLARHGVKVVDTDDGLQLARIADDTILDPEADPAHPEHGETLDTQEQASA